jgi:hypothetical protein
MISKAKFHHNNKKSEIFETPTGFTVNFYENNNLVHVRELNLCDNPFLIAEDFVFDGESGPKFLID